MFTVVHIPAPIFRYAKRPNFKARAVGYNYLTKTLKREGMIVWCCSKKGPSAHNDER